VDFNAERWNALLALARIDNCWSLQLLAHSLFWRRCSPIAESHCGGLVYWSFRNSVLGEFCRCFDCYGWVSGDVGYFSPAILTKFGPRTGSHSGTRNDMRPYFIEWWAHNLYRLRVKSSRLRIWCAVGRRYSILL